jgi:hypothetical protein
MEQISLASAAVPQHDLRVSRRRRTQSLLQQNEALSMLHSIRSSGRFFAFPAIAIIAIFAAPVRAAQVKENPEYAAWAKFKPGSTAVTVTELEGGGNKMTTERTSKLVEVSPDKLVLEVTSTVTAAGQTSTPTPRRQEVPAKKEETIATKDLPDEEVEAAGKKIKCKVREGTTMSGPANSKVEMKGKLYSSDTVPGGVVKMVLTSTRGTATTMLKSFEVK